MKGDTLFGEPPERDKEDRYVETLKNLDGMISTAIEKIRAMKEEKTVLERRIRELEAMLDARNEEIARLAAEKSAVKSQIEGLLGELEEIGL